MKFLPVSKEVEINEWSDVLKHLQRDIHIAHNVKVQKQEGANFLDTVKTEYESAISKRYSASIARVESYVMDAARKGLDHVTVGHLGSDINHVQMEFATRGFSAKIIRIDGDGAALRIAWV